MFEKCYARNACGNREKMNFDYAQGVIIMAWKLFGEMNNDELCLRSIQKPRSLKKPRNTLRSSSKREMRTELHVQGMVVDGVRVFKA